MHTAMLDNIIHFDGEMHDLITVLIFATLIKLRFDRS